MMTFKPGTDSSHLKQSVPIAQRKTFWPVKTLNNFLLNFRTGGYHDWIDGSDSWSGTKSRRSREWRGW